MNREKNKKIKINKEQLQFCYQSKRVKRDLKNYSRHYVHKSRRKEP